MDIVIWIVSVSVSSTRERMSGIDLILCIANGLAFLLSVLQLVVGWLVLL